jgi:hypothetical protein
MKPCTSFKVYGGREIEERHAKKCEVDGNIQVNTRVNLK